MTKVSIGFSTNKKAILSKIICWAQGTPYSHVYIRRDSKYGEYVYQASGLQVNFMNIETFLEHNTVIEEYEFDLPDDRHDELITFLIKYAGKPYSIKSLFQIGIMQVFKKVKFKPENEDSFVCSKLCAFFIETVLDLDVPGDYNFISPADLNPYIKTYGRRII